MDNVKIEVEVDPDEVLPVKVWRFLVRARDRVCVDCGGGGDPALGYWALQSHHLNHVGTDHRLSNGALLCSACHTERHAESRQAVGEKLRGRKRPAVSAALVEKWKDPEFRERACARRHLARRRKLTAEQVSEIRYRRVAGESRKALAEHYGVSPSMITDITLGKGRFAPEAGLDGPSKTVKSDPIRRTAPAPEPVREPAPEKVPAAPEREKEKVGS